MPLVPFLVITIVASVVWSVVVLGPSFFGAEALAGK
jgi:membrane protein DedA with SNARE-associated domain